VAAGRGSQSPKLAAHLGVVDGLQYAYDVVVLPGGSIKDREASKAKSGDKSAFTVYLRVSSLDNVRVGGELATE
jgi:hypothetical protein